MRAGVRVILQQAAGGEVRAELIDIGEQEGVEAEGFSGADVFDFVVEEEGFARWNAEPGAGEGVDGGVGLGDAELAGPGELVEVREPGEVLAHGAEDFGAHVGEDGGTEAGAVEGEGPGEHGLVDGGPHEDVGFDEGVDLGGGEGETSVAGKSGPVAAAVEATEVVVVAVAPVEAVEGAGIEAGEGDEAAVRGAVLGAEDFTVVEDDGADH